MLKLSIFMVVAMTLAAMAAVVPPYSSFPHKRAALSPPKAGAYNGHKVGTFSANQVRSQGFVPHGAAQYVKTLLKYNVPVPEDTLSKITTNLQISRRSDDNGTAKTTPTPFDKEYLTPVCIGTPCQTLNLDLDSGSADLWVFSTELEDDQVDGQTLYDASKSSTSQKLNGSKFDIMYGDLSYTRGEVVIDRFEIGGVTFDSQAIGVATKVSRQFTWDTDNDGLVGLSSSDLNTITPRPQKTFWDNIKNNLDSPVWTVDLKAGKPGTYNFGYIDDCLYTGNISYVDVDSTEGYWQIDTSGYTIGNMTNATTPNGFPAIVDTGTSLAILPTSVCEEYYKQVDGSKQDGELGMWTFPCNVTPPDFTYTVGNIKITILGHYMNYAPDPIADMCVGGIQENQGLPWAILGDVAMKAAFVVFEDMDGSTPRIGFAKKNL